MDFCSEGRGGGRGYDHHVCNLLSRKMFCVKREICLQPSQPTCLFHFIFVYMQPPATATCSSHFIYSFYTPVCDIQKNSGVLL